MALVALIGLCGSAARADDLPALYDVALPAQFEFLNVRAGPGTGFAAVGQLQPGQSDIEAVERSADREWLRILWGETSAWVFAPYMARHATDGYPVARQLMCGGTEPFWSLDLEQEAHVTFSVLDGDTVSSSAGRFRPANGRTDRFILDGTDFIAAIVRRTSCSDGMSDRVYGLDIDVLVTRGGTDLYSGCCRIAP